MKKTISTILIATVFAVTLLMPTGAIAAPVRGAVVSGGCAACPAGTFKVRKNTKTKKKLVNSLLAGGIGAAVGGGLGGGRGALLGLGTGAGGYLVYRYVKDRRGRCVPRVVRRG